MQMVTTVTALCQQISTYKKNGEKIVFVPTMGNLHAGHLALINHARICGGKIVCSIFVNALQFDRQEDLRAYPRTPKQDLEALRNADVDLVFMPEHSEVYAQQNRVKFPENPLNQQLCGKFRPGFFDGIVEVVTRLFYIVTPDVVVFGEKDYQQLVIIKQLVQDLGLLIRVEQIATQREADGLAFSSRNSYLDKAERKLAPRLYAELNNIKKRIEGGDRDFSALEKRGMKQLAKVGFRPDYVAIRDGQDLKVLRYDTDLIVILAAAWLGNARLIDNVLLPGA